MSVTPNLGAFNKDKVANKFGIQLKPKGASQQSSSIQKKTTTTTTDSSNVTKPKTINNLNGSLANTNRSTALKTVESPKKIPDKTSSSKSTSTLLNTSINNERSNSLTSNINHSTTTKKSPEASPLKSPATTKRSSIISTERAVSPTPPIKQPNTSITAPKTVAQVERQKDQPLYRRQLSKPLDNSSSNTTPTTTTTIASTNSLKR